MRGRRSSDSVTPAGVEELRPPALGLEPGERGVQRLWDQPVVVERDVDHVRLVGAEHAEGAHVGRRLRHDHVTGIDEDLRDEVEGLLRAGGDDDVVGVRVDGVVAHHLDDLLAHEDLALAGTVLECLRAVLPHDPGGELGEVVQRERVDVGHPPGEGDDLRPRGDGEQRADLGGTHAVGSLGVGVEPRVETVPSGGAGRLGHGGVPLSSRTGAERHLGTSVPLPRGPCPVSPECVTCAACPADVDS